MRKILEMMMLVAVATIAKLLFFLYRMVPFALLTGLIFYGARHALFAEAGDTYWWVSTLALSTLLALITHKSPAKDNPYRIYVGWLGWLEKRGDGLIAWIGTIKYFTSPYGLVEDPGSYKIRGEEVRTLIDTVLRPGDILLRGFDGYLDGLMISGSGSSGGKGNHFSHAALYLGDLHDDPDKPIVARRLQVLNDHGVWVEASPAQMQAVRNDAKYYQPGRQKIVHAMTKGVFTEDVLTFLRCDYVVVLRLPERFKLTAKEMEVDQSLIKDLAPDAELIRHKLLNGDSVTAAEVIDAIHLSALGKIGACYDFQFTDAKSQNRFSCSEFVYYCFKSIHCYIGLELATHAFLKIFFSRETITPADIYEAAVSQKKLQVIFESESLK